MVTDTRSIRLVGLIGRSVEPGRDSVHQPGPTCEPDNPTNLINAVKIPSLCSVSRATVLGKPFKHDLGTGDTVAGRSPSSQIVLSPGSVSRRHAKFRVDRDRCFVTDLGSRCGTFVGGGRIAAETEVVAGDRVRLGEVDLTLAHSEPVVQFDARPADATIVRKVGERSSLHTNKEVMTAERVLSIFAEVGRMLLSVRPLPEVLARLAELTFEVLPNERVFLLLADDEAAEGLRPAAMRPGQERAAGRDPEPDRRAHGDRRAGGDAGHRRGIGPAAGRRGRAW